MSGSQIPMSHVDNGDDDNDDQAGPAPPPAPAISMQSMPSSIGTIPNCLDVNISATASRLPASIPSPAASPNSQSRRPSPSCLHHPQPPSPAPAICTIISHQHQHQHQHQQHPSSVHPQPSPAILVSMSGMLFPIPTFTTQQYDAPQSFQHPPQPWFQLTAHQRNLSHLRY